MRAEPSFVKPRRGIPVPMNERVKGGFLGLAVGDCLGAPVEGMPAWEIAKRFERVTEILDPFEVWAARPERGRLRGLHTDDTQQAWMVADVLLANGRVVPEQLAARFVSFAHPRPDLPRGLHRGTGKFFRASVEKLAAGTPPLEAGADSAGNGAAMRVAPIGLRLAGDLDALVRSALLASAITHADARALESAAALAALVAALIQDAPPTGLRPCVEAALAGARKAEELLAAGDPVTLSAEARKYSGACREVLAGLLVRSDLPDAEFFRELANLAAKHSPTRKVKRASDAFALASVSAAIAITARASSFREALETAVNLGEDTDTLGAMTGALAGARFGAGAIPPEWLAAMVAVDALTQVAEALAGGAAAPAQEPLEETWTRLEHAEGARRAELADEDDDFDEDEDEDEDDEVEEPAGEDDDVLEDDVDEDDVLEDDGDEPKKDKPKKP